MHSFLFRRPSVLSLCLFGTLSASAAEVEISEFLASNVSGITDEDGDNSDWIELTNTSGSLVNLAGWSLTDNASSLGDWTFPSVTLNPGARLLIFASGKDRAVVGSELHTNFKLSTSGEFLALTRPDGVTVEDSFSPAYPQQYPDVSYGSGTSVGVTQALVGSNAAVRYRVPANASEDVGSGNPWNELSFNDSAWTAAEMGLGFATTTAKDDFDDFIGAGGDIQNEFYLQNSTVYLRIPFTIDDPTKVTSLSFKARYDDGFAIMINGSPILALANAPGDGIWDFEASAGGSHSDSEAIALEPFSIDLGQVNLVAGTNVLAIHALNQGASSSDFLIDCELDAQLSAGAVKVLIYMTTPSPGAENGGGVADLGPVVSKVTKNPPRPDTSIQSVMKITAKVVATQSPVARVDLCHLRGFGAESSIEMLDNGIAPDDLAGDGIFSVNLPLTGLPAGEMIRWRVEAQASGGQISKNPLYFDPLNSAQYYGTAALDPSLASDLPILEWFISNPALANNRTGSRAAVLYLGEFYDNVFCRVRGGSSAGLAKKSFKFDFNSEQHFRVDDDPDSVRVEEFNLNTTWTDKAYVRQPLSYEFYDLAGSPGPVCVLMRVEQNGAFFSVAAYTEQMDKRFLRRESRIDDDGALYKMFNTGTSGTAGVEKKNRTHESNADLSAFVSGMASTGTTLERFIFDNVDLPRQLNYLAATVLTQNNDNMSKNYYLYRDTEGSGEWTQMPWDTDLTWGSHYMTNDNIAHDGIWATQDYVLGGRNADFAIAPSHPFVGIQELPGNRSWNRIIDKLLENERFKDMFRRRLQTLTDQLLLTTEVDDRLDVMELTLGNDAVLDRAKWGQFGQQQTLTQALGILKNDYLIPRRNHLSVTHLAANAAAYPTPQRTSALLPGSQSMNPVINFASFEGNPASGNQDEEFIELTNAQNTPVDLSEWTLDGGVDFTFLPGTIIESNGSLFVSPKVAAFRARTSGPRGGQGLNVEGDYQGQISARGELIHLRDATGALVATLTTPDNPSLQQLGLRITELHFSPVGGKEFEYIEVRNISADVLDLTGIRLTDGVDALLSGMLAPGEYGLIVANPANFAGLNVVGSFAGALDNSGEQITLRDSAGENILSFKYDGDWFSPARNQGYSLVILDDLADWSTWDHRSSWALSSEIGGSPGSVNPGPYSNDYLSWTFRYFSVSDLANPAISGPSADASGDGVSNLMKYALGLDPRAVSYDALSEVILDGGNVALRFKRLQKTPDLSVHVETSTDLETWLPNTVLAETVDHEDGTETVTYQSLSDVPTHGLQFMRVRVIKN